ncbi:Ankyrin-2 [Geodia barretti]|uniref:Ankyrin-2 n=1 Tax=Geodia barretti TaxID=519541 RepID=A0AA35W8E1_GEOBA|nr:Ankyrin-2 [Geodia barretti]
MLSPQRAHTALHETCQEGHTHLSLLLISLGADLQARSREGWTPLMCASSRGHLQLLSILAATGGNVNDLTRTGLTPLHIAAWKGHTAVVQKLLGLGCNPAAVAHSGKTALQLASEEEHRETVTVLQAAAAKMSQEPTYSISSLEGQLRLCQEKLAQVLSHHEQVIAAELHLRDEKEMKLKTELEQERAKVARLEAQVGPENRGSGETTAQSADFNGRESDEEYFFRAPNQEAIKLGTPIVKSASSSDIFASSSRPSPFISLPHSSSHNSSERCSITDMVTECMRNPSSMASIRSNLKADNLTPRIQRKFRYKTTSATLPAVGSVPSPLTKDGARAATDTGYLPTTSRAPPKP